MRAVALFCFSVSREIPPSLLSPERVLDTFEESQESPRHPHLQSRGTQKVLPQPKKSPGSPSSSPRRVRFPASSRKESGIPITPKEEAEST